MLIARSPLRVSLGGGGTDVPSYYREHEGFLLAAAIDKYVYVTVMRPFTEGIYLKYSEIEHSKEITNVKHPIIREVLRELNLKTPFVHYMSSLMVLILHLKMTAGSVTQLGLHVRRLPGRIYRPE